MMTPYRRELMMRVMDNRPEIPPILHAMDCYVKCDEILHWLVVHKFTGLEFLSFLHLKFNGSPYQLAKFVLGKIKKSNFDHKIILGRDIQ